MSKKVITGTGRCGTSFIMQLLTNLGEKTGYTREEAEYEIKRIDNLNAGIEHDTAWNKTKAAEWIKNPSWINVRDFEYLQSIYRVKKVYIPIRDLVATAKSREYQNENTHGGYGGFWDANNVDEQKTINAKRLYHFLLHLETIGLDYTLISFEIMMKNPMYLMTKLDLDIDSTVFKNEYNNLLDPEKIRF